MAKVEIKRIDEYEMYLRNELKKYLNEPHTGKKLKKEEKLEVVIEHMMIAFIDGIRFNQGRLKVDVDN